jgi:hypothetical protein
MCMWYLTPIDNRTLTRHKYIHVGLAAASLPPMVTYLLPIVSYLAN